MKCFQYKNRVNIERVLCDISNLLFEFIGNNPRSGPNDQLTSSRKVKSGIQSIGNTTIIKLYRGKKCIEKRTPAR